MAKIPNTCLKWLIHILVVISIQFCDAENKHYRNQSNLYQFEQMKSELFTKNRNEEFRYQNLSPNDEKCLMEINAIRNSLDDAHLWAVKLVDAWGKLPSALLDGNLYDFGGFSECFHIERNEQKYETKYCLGQMEIDINNAIISKKELNALYNGIYPEMYISPSDIDGPTSLRPWSGTAFTFGLCVPIACSMDYLQSLLGKYEYVNRRKPIRFLENTCQFEEKITRVETKDWIAIGIFGVVLALMVLSTIYDIVHTFYNSGEKSQALSAFSAYSNAKYLLSYEEVKSPNVIQCLHGIRALITPFVILVHVYKMYLNLPLRNKGALKEYMHEFSSVLVLSSEVGVEAFFVISGILVTINLLKVLEKSQGKLNVLSLYIHRYFRLTPLFAATILYTATLMKFNGDGPLWPNVFRIFGGSCERNAWLNVLYIHNYINNGVTDMCLAHTWWLAADMQLFIISPLIVYLIYRFKKGAIIGFILVMFGTIGWTIVVYVHFDMNEWLSMPKLVYAHIPTHLRCSTWLVGVITGYTIYESKKRVINIPKLLDVISWMLSIAVLTAFLYLNYLYKHFDLKLPSFVYGLFDSAGHIVWSIALSYLIFASVHNAGGPFVRFLSHPLWQPLSRLSYATYVIHLCVLYTFGTTIKTPIYFSELFLVTQFIAFYVITLIASIIVSLAFELPVANIEKLLFCPKKKTDLPK